MNAEEFEAKLRAGEYFHHLTVPPGMWAVLRMDGRSFSSFTEKLFDKPFDYEFHELMASTVRAVVAGFNAVYGYTESDEISLLLRHDFNEYSREVEKLVSLSASMASAAFMQNLIALYADRAVAGDYGAEAVATAVGNVKRVALDNRVWRGGGEQV